MTPKTDDIFALATPLGQSALAVIRTAGASCIERIAPSFTKAHALRGSPSHRVLHGWLRDGERNLDEVTLAVFRSPRSYTGEDAVEIYCHGSIPCIEGITAHLLSIGFRQAEPGEFTLRAVVNGKLELTQAEAVGELIRAQGSRSQSQALHRLAGAVHREIDRIKNEIVNILAAVSVQLDYPDDELPNDRPNFAPSSFDSDSSLSPNFAPALHSAIAALSRLSKSYSASRLYQDGAKVVLAGRTNAGKSSLFNRLLREERAIVSEQAGTTRDYLETRIRIQGIPLRLYDTAGIRSTQEGVESEGIRRSEMLVESADLVVYLVDGTADAPTAGAPPLGDVNGTSSIDSDLQADLQASANTSTPKPKIYLWTKCDLANCLPAPQDYIPVSSTSGRGIGDLHKRIIEIVSKGIDASGEGEVLIDSLRQKQLIDSAQISLQNCLASIENGLPLDILALDLQESVNALAELTGEVTSEDILDRIFSQFCLGK